MTDISIVLEWILVTLITLSTLFMLSMIGLFIALASREVIENYRSLE